MIATLAWIVLGVSLVPAHRAARRSRTLLVALLVSEAIALAMVVLAGTSAQTWAAFAQEDGTIEWATFFAFVLAAGWLVVVVRKHDRSWWFQGATLLLALFCVAVAGEEISWGQRLFGFKPPDLFLERNFQQELNLHNVLMDESGLGFKLESKHLVIAIALGFAIAWPVIVRRRRFALFAPLAPPLALAPLALGVAAAELSYTVELTGEGAELVTGYLFLAAAIVCGRREPPAEAELALRPTRADLVVAGWLIAPLVLGAITSAVMSRIVFGSDEDGAATAQAELQELRDDVVRGATDKLARKNVHKRVYTSVRDGYLQLSDGAFIQRGSGRHAYFLDPWNNPYWIHYDRRARIGHVYSFGPNRRRDVAIRRSDSEPGDDIIVDFQLPGAREE